MVRLIKVTGITIALLIVTVIVVGVVLAVGKQPPEIPASSESAMRLQPGPYTVAQYDELMVDTKRPTQPNGDYAGADSRSLAATVWYPAGKIEGGFPLIVHSHGFSSDRSGGRYLAKHLASMGYVVIAADFPLTSRAAPGGPLTKDVVNQPGDVTFMVDTLLAYSAEPDHPLTGMIDPERVGLMGISLGGLTTTLAAYHPTMGDPRVSAALSIAGPTDLFTAEFFRQPSPAFLMLAGTADALVPYQVNALPVLQKVPGAKLVTIAAGSHIGFAGNAGLLRWIDHPDAVACYMVLRSIESDGAEESWLDLLGTPEQGINYEITNNLCTQNSLPTALNALRQQQITQLVVSSFFESRFAASNKSRSAALTFLQQTLPKAFSEVKYASAMRY